MNIRQKCQIYGFLFAILISQKVSAEVTTGLGADTQTATKNGSGQPVNAPVPGAPKDLQTAEAKAILPLIAEHNQAAQFLAQDPSNILARQAMAQTQQALTAATIELEKEAASGKYNTNGLKKFQEAAALALQSFSFAPVAPSDSSSRSSRPVRPSRVGSSGSFRSECRAK